MYRLLNHMIRVSLLLVFFLSFVAIVMMAQPVSVASQSVSSQIQLSRVIQDVQAVEQSGANPDEMRDLADQLNTMIALQYELQNLPPQELDKRAQLSEQINNTLTAVDTQSNEIAIRASQRTSISHLVAYSSGVVGAVIATVVFHYGMLLRRRYRVKRTFRMKIIQS